MTADVKAFLLSRHPWYARMTGRDNWPKIRAVRGALNEEATKREYLIRGKFEKDDHYATRVRLSEFAGVTTGIIERFTGAIFENPIEVTYDAKGAQVDLEGWAKDIDGQGTALFEFVKNQAPDVVGMGGVGVFVDMEQRTPEQMAQLASSSDRSMDFLKRNGIPWAPRLVPYQVEEITNWQLDRSMRPEWLVLTRIISDQAILGKRVPKVEWLVVDRTSVQVYRAGFKDAAGYDFFALTIDQLYAFENNIEDPQLHAMVAHGCGCVPMAWLGDPQHPLWAAPMLMGTVRADISAFNEASQGDFSRYIHNIPAQVLKTKRLVSEVIRDPSVAIVLNPEDNESFAYASTPSDGFELTMKAVENKNLNGFRQAGADPTGMFEQTSTPESGTAKKSRFSNTEARLLSKLAGWFQSGHWAILELVARKLSGEPPPADAKVFAGTVRYPSKFSEDDITDLIDQFGSTKEWLADSETFLRTMLTRIALTIMGDVSEEKKAAVSDDIGKLTLQQLRDRVVILSAPNQQGASPAPFA